MSRKVEDFTIDGKCSNCGQCCADMLPVSKKEMNKIKHYVRKHNIKPYLRTVVLAEKTVDFRCPFRDDSKKQCNIYDVRPEICRKFICNQSEETILKNRNLISSRNKTISMKNEVYGNDENILYLKYKMGVKQ